MLGDDVPGFDPAFYRAMYPDLAALRSPWRLAQHYVRFGRREGRFPNREAALADAQARYGALPEEFDADSYRRLNPDLASLGEADIRYILHFLQFGRKEGRLHRLEDLDPEERIEPWRRAFRVPDFLAWASPWLNRPVRTREEAIAAFLDDGITRLCPIANDLIFDPAFYRAEYDTPAGLDDAALYRHWLETGIGQGRAPNETVALRGCLGRTPFPEGFDLAAYRRASGLGAATRAQALRHLFDVTAPAGGEIDRFFATPDPRLHLALGRYHLARGHAAVVEAPCTGR